MSFSQVTLSQVELDTVLAALRLFQATPRNQVPEAIMEIATDHSASALHPEEIDELCECLNVSPEEPAGAGQGDYHLVSYGHGEHGEESLAVVDSQRYPASSISCRACRHSGLVCDFDGSRIPGEEVPPFGYGIESNGKMGRDRQWRWYHPAPHGGHGNWCATDIEACIDAHGNADWPCRTTD